ncbi:speckle targeted PIP5K1A-regulated poly(A) polymerase [Catharus ustulatus]|uniref:speckle targeted PIP5K1A-regulated poly(A) polymerase n=1 Tax=Catharus ustulatus TaxID=91951 RepID=UPI001C5B91C7|nr:speckle targeted PIP5K1A-regulated poly(A) polymerase [Catharus ustulatus]
METEPEPGPDPGPHMEPVTGPVPVTDPAADPDVEPLHRGGFRCRLCQITAANLPSLRSHLAGKRHRRLRWLRAERRAQEQRSLFVSGFPRGTEPARLRQHFRAFGDVATVVMDKEKGAFAIVELRDPAGRQRALEQPRHELGGRRLRVRPREHREFPRPPPRDPPGTPPVPPGLLQALGQAQDVGAQLELLVRALELSAAERRLRELLLSLIREVFGEFFPGCSVVPYGSSVNGFDVHGCDLDLHLELGTGDGDPQSQGTPNWDPKTQETPNGDPQTQETPNGDPKTQETPNRDPQTPRGPCRVMIPPRPRGPFWGAGGPFWGAGPPPEELLALVGAVLRRCVPGVRGVRAVPGARRPVVKFSHKQSGLAGDVCLDNRLALFNTRFLRLCAELDPRVRPLGYAVRLWAGGQRLAGNRAGGGPLLTNYALTLLVVLFLQSRSPPVLPSLRHLRHLAGPQDRAQVGGWDCSFPRDAAGLERSGNGQSAASLLAEFFSYFGTLDLGGLLLSPLEGRALPRPPPETLGGLRPGPLTLQDPFELSHNVAANVTPRTVSRFVRCCRDAARLCRGPEFHQKSRRGRPWGVMRLLQPGPAESCGNSRGKFLIPVPLPCPGGAGGVPPRRVGAAAAFVLTEVLGCGCEPRGDFGDMGTAGEAPPGAECHLEGVAGDSRGEFEDLGTSGEPPPAARCRLEKVARGSQGEFGDTGTSGDGGTPPPGDECHLEGVAGDSRREFRAMGTAGESPSGAECHLEGVAGDTQGEFGDAGTSGNERTPPPGAECHLEGVTGDSRGEFGDARTSGESPPAAECHLEGMAGDSQGEFGDAGTSGEAPSGAECHLEGVAGDSRGEFGDAGTSGNERTPPLGAECHLEGVAGDSRGELGDMGTAEESPSGAECHLEGVAGDSRGELGTSEDDEEPLLHPLEPPPGAECHLEGVAGDSRGEFGDAVTPGPGWKRRLPEGVPVGAGVPPAKRPRLPPVPSRWSCCVRYRVWRGRRRLRRRLLHREGPGMGGPGGSGGAQGPGDSGGPGGVRDLGGPAVPGGAPAPGDLGGPGGRSPDLGGPGGEFPDLGGSPLALERAVTEAIVRGDTGTPPEPLLRFQLSAHRGGSRRDPQILLRLQPEPDPPSPLFQEFFHFLRGFLPEMVRQRLRGGDFQ